MRNFITKNKDAKTKEAFCFSQKNLALAKEILAKYPINKSKSAVMPLLDMAQRQIASQNLEQGNQEGGWLPVDVMKYIADFLKLPEIKVFEVASFYTMYNLKPVGKIHLQLCRTTPCWLKGCNNLLEVIKEECNIKHGQTTEDGMFTLTEVECLGACANAPVIQINDDYYEDLTPQNLRKIIKSIRAGQMLAKGSQSGRKSSEPK